jgi:pimeloyl-ACP methyl ester carboxylesterase
MSRKTYLLVSGAWHGAWCWERVARVLEGAGHLVIAPDLPGCCAGDAESATVTLDQWANSICERLEAQADPAILVGHSRAGIVISEAAERMPERIARLVYVSGLMLRHGESVLRLLREDRSSPFLRHVSLSQSRRHWLLAGSSARELFYGECSAEDADLAVSKLGVEPAAPLMTPLHVTDGRFGQVPRSYLECLRDAAVPLVMQRKMQERLPCDHVTSIDTGHAPFLSAPDALAARLLELPA